MNKKKILATMGLVVIGILVLGFSLNQAIAVETIEVEDQVFTDSFREDGIVFAESERPLVAEVGGIVADVHAQNGDDLLVGDIILALDTKQLELKKQAIEGQIVSLKGQEASEAEKVKKPDLEAQKHLVSMVKSNRDQVQADFERTKALYESGAVSLQAFENAQQAYKSAEDKYQIEVSRLDGLQAQNQVGKGQQSFYDGQLIQLQAELELVKDQIDKSVLRAQSQGTITGLDVKVGQALMPMSTVGKIINDHALKIESMVLAENVLDLKVGQDAQIIQTRKGLEKVLSGKIVKIAPVAEETISALGLKERRVKVTLIPNDGGQTDFMAGLDVDVKFIAYQSENTLVVPKSSVFPMESGDGVWVIRDGKVSLQRIETGYESTRYVEVVSGLQAGEHILKNYDAEGVEEGIKVKSDNL